MGEGRHTGEYSVILGWYIEHPDAEMSIGDIVKEFDISRQKASNILAHWTRSNKLAKVEGKRGYFKLRNPDQKREEFKVARRAIVKEPEPTADVIPFPVVREYDILRINEPVKMWLNAQYGKASDDRFQAIDANTVIVWNSPEHRENMRRMALSH